jgi:hypothetical protein
MRIYEGASYIFSEWQIVVGKGESDKGDLFWALI